MSDIIMTMVDCVHPDIMFHRIGRAVFNTVVKHMANSYLSVVTRSINHQYRPTNIGNLTSALQMQTSWQR